MQVPFVCARSRFVRHSDMPSAGLDCSPAIRSLGARARALAQRAARSVEEVAREVQLTVLDVERRGEIRASERP